MITFDSLVDWLTEQFDISQARLVAVVNERHRELISEARWLVTEGTLATTVAGQATYAVPGTVVHVRLVQIAGQTYSWASEDDILQFNATTDADVGFFFAPAFDSSGNPLIRLWPTPATSGLAITAIETGIPADMAYGSSTALGVPQDLVMYLRAGCRSTLLREVSERPDLAAGDEQMFGVGVQRLRAHRNSLIGPGVNRIRVEGFDFTVT